MIWWATGPEGFGPATEGDMHVPEHSALRTVPDAWLGVAPGISLLLVVGAGRPKAATPRSIIFDDYSAL